MAEEPVERRLTAVLAADIAGYSRLMGSDEEGTLTGLKMVRREVTDPKIEQHRGRIVQTAGDGLSAEFASVVDAMRCALEVQHEMATRNAGIPTERRLQIRLGINLGDVMVDDKDIFGDGVNVAARLETLADPGGICVSRAVRDQVRDKLAVSFEDLGDQQVKNIARPVRAYRVLLAAKPSASSASPETEAPRPLADRPSIAVLPFKNVTGDSEQEYFVGGISEDIITALSKWRWFLVIARAQGRAARAHHPPVDRCGDRYPSLGRALRSRSDRHFAVQDEITSRVVTAIEPMLSRAESQRGAAKRPEHMGAWDYCQRGFWHLNRLTGRDGEAAYGVFKTAVALDPGLAEAHLGLARSLIAQWDYGSVEDFAPMVREARVSALEAAQLDGENPYAQYVLAQTSHWAGDAQAAIAYASRAIELNENFALGHFYLGISLNLDGRHDEALEALETGLRLSPRDPRMATWHANKARILYHLRRYPDAIEAALAARRIQPHAYGSLVLVASYAQLERDAEAQSIVAELRAVPGGIGKIAQWYLDRYSDRAALEHRAEGLRKAGAGAVGSASLIRSADPCRDGGTGARPAPRTKRAPSSRGSRR